MTIAHATEIHFGGRREAAKKRIQRLKAAGLLRDRRRMPYEPSILHLASKGVTALSERGILAEYPPLSRLAIKRRNQVSEQTLRHELQVMDLKAAFYRAVRTRIEIKVLSFCTWPLLNEFAGSGNAWAQRPWTVRPDGLLRVSCDHRIQSVYLELDRSTESQETLLAKAQRYADHQGSTTVREPVTIQFIFLTDARKRNASMAFAKLPRIGGLRLRTSTLKEMLSQTQTLLS